MPPITYKKAGVDIDKADTVLIISFWSYGEAFF
jgi:hypothetical protein